MINCLRRWDSYIIFGLILILWLLQTKTTHESWNESTRLATAQALVEYGTWRIDLSPYGHETGDKLLLDGHYYSEKPPLFAAIGAVFYAIMHYGLGAKLAIDGCQPGTLCVYYWLTILMVGLPSAIMAALFYQLAWSRVGSRWWAVTLTMLFCFGTVVWPYSLVFNHHLPAAIALFISFYLLFDGNSNRFYIFLAGLLVGVAVMFDLTSVFLAFAIFSIVVIYNRPDTLFFIGAALIPLGFTIIFNYEITGGFLFPYFSSEGYNYPGSPWDTTVGGQHPPDNALVYAFRSFLGDHGLFGYSPLLLFAIAGLIRVVGWIDFRSSSIPPVVVKSSLVLLGVVAHLLFVLTQTNNFGGDAYGGRFLIPFIPILFFFILFFIPAYFYKPGGLWKAICFCIAIPISLFSAYQGVQATWHNLQPPFFAKILSEAPYLAIETNLRVPDEEPENRKHRLIRNFEAPFLPHRLGVTVNNELALLGYDLAARRIMPGQNLELTLYWQLLRVPEQDYFVFTHLLNKDQAQQGSAEGRLQEEYPARFWVPGEIVVDQRQVPIDVDAETGLAWLRLGLYQLTNGDGYVPAPLTINGQVTQETSLTLGKVLIGPATPLVDRQHLSPQERLAVQLGQPPVIALRGYDLTQIENELQLILYWESLRETAVDWSVFVHLQNSAGQIVAQQDRPAGDGIFPTSLWEAEEVIRDPIRLIIPPEVESGQYRLVAGLYQPDTGIRLVATATNANTNSVELGAINLDR